MHIREIKLVILGEFVMRSLLCKVKYTPKYSLFGVNYSGTLYFEKGEMQACYSVDCMNTIDKAIIRKHREKRYYA